MSKKWQIDRRTVLRGLGATVALPFLEAMMPLRAFAQSSLPPKLCVLKTPLGVHPESWATTGTGTNFSVPAQLATLVNAHRNDLILLKGLHNHLDLVKDEFPGVPTLYYVAYGVSHYQATAGYLTCAQTKRGTNYPVSVGTSFDQIIAKQIGLQTKFPSIVLKGVENVAGGDESNGHNKLYRTNISWVSATTPATAINHPVNLFNKMFGDGPITQPGDPAAARRKQYNLSVLDAIKDDAAALKAKLGKSDREKLDEYLTSLNEVERRVNAISVPMPATCNVPATPSGKYDYPTYVKERMRAMFDLLVIAFKCDMTRVATYLIEEEYTYFNSKLIISEAETGLHNLSHFTTATDGNIDPAIKKNAYKAVNKWYFDEFSSFLTKLKAVKTPTGNLLDEMIVVMGSGLGDSSSHQSYDLPMIVAGKGAGKLRTGQLVETRVGYFAEMVNTRPQIPTYTGRRQRGRPLADLWLTLMQKMGVNQTKFGNSTGPITQLG